MGAISGHFDIGQAAVQAVNVGADIVMVAHDYAKATAVLEALKQAAASSVLSQKRIDRSVYRGLALKQKYQLSDRPAAEPDLKGLNDRVYRALDAHAGSN